MISVNRVWDSTTEVMAGRLGLIAPIAALTVFVPPVIRQGYALAVAPAPTMGMVVVGMLLSLISALAAVWGQLAILAIAIDLDTTGRDAAHQATSRFLPVIGVAIVITAAAVLLLLPLIIAVAGSGVDWRALSAANGQMTSLPTVKPGVLGFVALYGLFLLAVGLWAAARLMPVYAVVLNERRGVGAIGRAIALTRGDTWRLIGTVFLFVLVLFVAMFAVQAVLTLIARLIAGPDQQAGVLFVGGVGAALVTTIFTALAYVFIARLYVAARANEPASAAAPVA